MKRANTTDPLTPDDVAERTDRAAMRALRILMDVRQSVDLFEQVKRSRYLTNSLELLQAEIEAYWSVSPLVD